MPQNELPRFFKRYQIQHGGGADRPARGRFREFYQCDLDTIGTTSPLVEAEQMSAVAEDPVAPGISGLRDPDQSPRDPADSCCITNGDVAAVAARRRARVVLDKLDKVGRDGVSKELAEKGVSDVGRDALLNWMGAGARVDWLDWLERELDAAEHPAFLNREADPRSLRAHAGRRAFSLRPEPRGADCRYTGAIMEIAVSPIWPAVWGRRTLATISSACFSAASCRPADSRSGSNAFSW